LDPFLQRRGVFEGPFYEVARSRSVEIPFFGPLLPPPVDFSLVPGRSRPKLFLGRIGLESTVPVTGLEGVFGRELPLPLLQRDGPQEFLGGRFLLLKGDDGNLGKRGKAKAGALPACRSDPGSFPIGLPLSLQKLPVFDI